MGNGYGTAQSDETILRDTVLEIQRRLRELEALDGTQIYNTVQDLKNLIDGLLNQVNGIFTGYVQAGGNITTTGGDFIASSGYLRSVSGSVFDITTPRNQTWWRLSDGRLAYASSSRTKKTNLRDPRIDPLAVLGMTDTLYNYIAEVRKRDDPEYENYVGPHYHVATELGLIAEQLHELGLWQLVQYEREPDPAHPLSDDQEPILRLKLSEDGEPIPVSIHYSMVAVALLPVLRAGFEWMKRIVKTQYRQAQQIKHLQRRLAEIED